METFRLFHSFCWSDKDNCPTNPVIKTKRGDKKYRKIWERLTFIEDYTAQHGQYPIDYGEDNFSSEEEVINVENPPLPRHRPIVPGDFVLTFDVLVLANAFESQFPYQAEYWWTQLPGNLDQACVFVFPCRHGLINLLRARMKKASELHTRDFSIQLGKHFKDCNSVLDTFLISSPQRLRCGRPTS